MKKKVKASVSNDDTFTTRIGGFTTREAAPAPSEYGNLPQIVDHYDFNAKLLQKGKESKAIKNRIEGSLCANEMQDDKSDVNFNGYCNGN